MDNRCPCHFLQTLEDMNNGFCIDASMYNYQGTVHRIGRRKQEEQRNKSQKTWKDNLGRESRSRPTEENFKGGGYAIDSKPPKETPVN